MPDDPSSSFLVSLWQTAAFFCKFIPFLQILLVSPYKFPTLAFLLSWYLGEGDGSESDDRSTRPEDSISQVGSAISPAHDSVEELSDGDAVWSLSKIHSVPDVSSLAIKPACKPDSSRAVLQEQASTSGEGLVVL